MNSEQRETVENLLMIVTGALNMYNNMYADIDTWTENEDRMTYLNEAGSALDAAKDNMEALLRE